MVISLGRPQSAFGAWTHRPITSIMLMTRDGGLDPPEGLTMEPGSVNRDAAHLSPLVLATLLAPHWESRGQFGAGRETLARLLIDREGSAAERAAAYGAIAHLAMAQGDHDAARFAHESALAIHESRGDRRSAAASRNALANVLLAAEELQQLGDVRGIAFAHASRGLIAATRGDVASAYDHMLETFGRFRSLDALAEAASVLVDLARVAMDTGERQRATRFTDGALRLFTRVADRRGPRCV